MSIKEIREKITKFESKLISLSLLLTAISFAGKGLGLLKVHLFARLFDAGKALDIFYAAFALPDFVFTLLVVGTVNAALVPIFIKILKKKDQKLLHETLSTTIITLAILMAIFLGIIFFAMPAITNFLFSQPDVTKELNISFVESTTSKDQYKELFTNLSRLMLISPLLLSISSVIGAYLQAHKRFISTAMAPVMYNVGILLGIAFFVNIAPNYNIYALSYSVILGTILHFITQLIGFINLHERKFKWSFHVNAYVKRIGKLSFPRIMGLGVEQMAILFNTFWGFTLGKGALSVFKFASTLYLLPIDLISSTFLQILFPRLNEKAHEDDNYHSLNKLYWRTLIFLILITVPIAILFTILRLPIVRLAFGAGKFSWNATLVTSFTLTFLTPAILFQAIAALNIRTFYATNNTKTPFFISIVGVVLNVIFSIGFTNFFSHYHDVAPILYNPRIWIQSIPTLFSYFFTKNGSFAAVAGLAFGISMGLLFEVLVSFFLLSKKTHHLRFATQKPIVMRSFATIAISGAMVALAGYLTYRIADSSFDTTRTAGVISVALLTTFVSLVTYAVSSYNVIKQYFSIQDAFSKIQDIRISIKNTLKN